MRSGICTFDIETLGFDKFNDRVVCACYKPLGEEVFSFSEFDERMLLENFFDSINYFDPALVISYNGYLFDLPFLWAKAIKYNLKLPRCFTDPHLQLDLWYELTHKGKGKLSDFAQILGLESIGIGSEVPKLWEEGKIDEIVAHCESDLEITEALYTRAKGVGLLG